MSFSFAAFGNKQQVAEQLKASTGSGDASMHDAMRDAGLKIAEAAPDDVTFAIEANGHHHYGAHGGNPVGNVTFTLKVYRPKPQG